ncbi:MAG: hypothetical protein J0M00_07055 [Burkholderiales bacterium]|nr:hypothetical protein [Burkholderiales bacterium]
MKLLLSGLDTVECAYYLREGLHCGFDFAGLAARREAMRASKQRDLVVVSIGGKDFLLGRGGTQSGYPLMLSNGEQSIQCGEFNNPSFFVTYRSEALWHKGAQRLHEDFKAWAHGLRFNYGHPEGLSRVDFTFDFELPTIDFDEDCFVTLAEKDAQHRKNRKVQTFSFGRGDIVLRVYDKSAEIEESSGKTWFHALWGGVEENVWRIEFQVRKAVLRRFSIRTFDDLFTGCGDVLRHLAHEHTTLRVRQDDSNRSRWPLHPLWAMLQEHIATLPAQGVVREVNADERLLEQMLRLAVSVEGYMKRSAAIECVRRGGELLSHEAAIREFNVFLRQVHDPLTWASDVLKRADEIRLGQI